MLIEIVLESVRSFLTNLIEEIVSDDFITQFLLVHFHKCGPAIIEYFIARADQLSKLHCVSTHLPHLQSRCHNHRWIAL